MNMKMCHRKYCNKRNKLNQNSRTYVPDEEGRRRAEVRGKEKNEETKNQRKEEARTMENGGEKVEVWPECYHYSKMVG